MRFTFSTETEMVRRLFSALAMAMVLGLAAPIQPANASYFAQMTVEDMSDAATYIVEGTVTRVWTELSEREIVWTRAEVKLIDQLKGDKLPETIIVDSMGGSHHGYELAVIGQAVFSEGEHLFTFLHQNRAGRLVPVAKFLGKYTVRRAPGERRHHLVTWHPSKSFDFDHRFIPHPAAADRIYFDAFADQIRDHLNTPYDGREIPGISVERLKQLNTPERRIVR
jgi:sugar lactone lactonase YvrE